MDSSENNSVNLILEQLPVAADFIGVDFLLDRGNLIFNEIEDVVGSKMLYASSELDVAHMFTGHIQKSLLNTLK